MVGVNEDVIAGGVIINRLSPNPTSDVSSVSISLPREMNVSMTLVDASGSVVATIVNQTMSAGSHRIQIEAARYSSGAYMLQTVVGGARQIQTMMIVK